MTPAKDILADKQSSRPFHWQHHDDQRSHQMTDIFLSW